MKRLYILLLLFVVAMNSIATDRTGNIPLGLTMLSPSMTMTAADSINESDTITFTIANLQKYMQLQVFTVTLDNISGTTDVAVTAYGKVTSTSSYVQIGSPVTLSADGTATITATSPINYNYLKVELVAGAGDQHSHITSFVVKNSNAYQIPANSGTLTVSRADAGTVTITSADNNADAALIVGAGGTGALTLGDAGSTTAVTSSDWAIGATGIMTGIGAITNNGLITASAGATITGAAVNLNASSNFAVNIGTGTTNAAVAVGGGSNTVAVNSSDWDVDATGIMTNMGTYNSYTISGGIAGLVTTATADADSTVTASILTAVNQFVTVTSGGADRVVTLPATSASTVGMVVRGYVGATGFELRVATADKAAVKINDVTGSVEAAIPATTFFTVQCVSATQWILTATDEVGAVVTAIIPDAI